MTESDFNLKFFTIKFFEFEINRCNENVKLNLIVQMKMLSSAPAAACIRNTQKKYIKIAKGKNQIKM